MKDLPKNVSVYKKTNTFTQNDVPKGLLKDHATKEGTWGKICVLEGRLLYTIIESNEVVELNSRTFGVVEPTISHKILPIGEVKFYVEFYR